MAWQVDQIYCREAIRDVTVSQGAPSAVFYEHDMPMISNGNVDTEQMRMRTFCCVPVSSFVGPQGGEPTSAVDGFDGSAFRSRCWRSCSTVLLRIDQEPPIGPAHRDGTFRRGGRRCHRTPADDLPHAAITGLRLSGPKGSGRARGVI